MHSPQFLAGTFSKVWSFLFCFAMNSMNVNGINARGWVDVCVCVGGGGRDVHTCSRIEELTFMTRFFMLDAL